MFLSILPDLIAVVQEILFNVLKQFLQGLVHFAARFLVYVGLVLLHVLSHLVFHALKTPGACRSRQRLDFAIRREYIPFSVAHR